MKNNQCTTGKMTAHPASAAGSVSGQGSVCWSKTARRRKRPRRSTKKSRMLLDKSRRRDIMSLSMKQNAVKKPALRNRLSARGRWCEPSAHAARQPLWSVPQGAGRFIPVTGWLRCLPRGIIRVVPRRMPSPLCLGRRFFWRRGTGCPVCGIRNFCRNTKLNLLYIGGRNICHTPIMA